MLLLLLPGCPPQKIEVAPRPDVMPTYRELATGYNANLTDLHRLWSRAVVDFHWQDDDGRKHHERGDGHLIIALPDKLALTLGKAGIDFLWIGCNEKSYWFFNLQDEGKVYFGQHANVGRPGSRGLPGGIHPLMLPYLMGMVPIDAENDPPAPAVEWVEGRFVIEPPNLGLRISLDGKTRVPVRIDLLDRAGQSLLVSRLAQYQVVRLEGKPSSQWPGLPNQVEIQTVGQYGKVALRLADMTDNSDRIKPRIFDFNVLLKIHKPAERIDLDADVSP
ncbi:MAG: hypothetical protein WEC36_09600 [Phycisphaeraceae bacterium]